MFCPDPLPLMRALKMLSWSITINKNTINDFLFIFPPKNSLKHQKNNFKTSLKSFLSLLFNIYDYTDKKRTYLFLFVVIFIAQKSHSLYALVIPCLSPFICSRGKWQFTPFLLKDGFHIPYLEKNQRSKAPSPLSLFNGQFIPDDLFSVFASSCIKLVRWS